MWTCRNSFLLCRTQTLCTVMLPAASKPSSLACEVKQTYPDYHKTYNKDITPTQHITSGKTAYDINIIHKHVRRLIANPKAFTCNIYRIWILYVKNGYTCIHVECLNMFTLTLKCRKECSLVELSSFRHVRLTKKVSVLQCSGSFVNQTFSIEFGFYMNHSPYLS